MSWRAKSYEVLPALSVRREELRRSLRTVTAAWMYGVVWMSCIHGSHVIVFVRKLGFTEFHLGLMAAVPYLARAGQVVASILIARTGLRKYLFLFAMGTSRAIWLLVAAIPLLLPIPSAWAVRAMLVILLVSWFLCMVGYTSWVTWMGDLIPRRIRGRYLAVRTRLTRLVQIAVVIALGVIVDRVMRQGSERAVLWTISGIFVAAAVFGTADVLLFRRIREVFPTTAEVLPAPEVTIEVRPARRAGVPAAVGYGLRYLGAVLREFLLVPLKDRAFRHYVGHGATLAAAMAVAGSFFFAFCLEDLHFSTLTVNVLFMVGSPLAAIASAKTWGKLIDRWGRRPTLVVANTVIVFSVMPYFLATPTWWAPGVISLSCIIGGAGWSGVLMAQMGVMLGFSEGPGRSRYVAGAGVLIGLGGLLGGWLGGTVAFHLAHLRQAPLLVGPFVWNNRHATFALSMLARMLGLLWLVGMPDPGSGRVRDLARRMRLGIYNSVAARLYYPFRLVTSLRGARRGAADNNRPAPEDEP